MTGREQFAALPAEAGNPYAEALCRLAAALQTPDGITQPQLCRQLNIHPSSLRRQRKALARVAELFGWEVGKIVEEGMPVRWQLRYTDAFGPADADPAGAARRFPLRGGPDDGRANGL